MNCFLFSVYTCIQDMKFLVFFFTIYNSLVSSDLIQIRDKKEVLSITPYTKYMVDDSKTLQIKQIIEDGNINWSSSKNFESLSLGFKSSNIWIQFDLENICCESSDWYLEIAYPPLDHIDFYQVKFQKIISEVSDGDLTEIPKNAIQSNYFNFHIDLKKQERSTIYLKISSESSLAIPLSLQSAESLAEKFKVEQFLFGIFTGILLIMCFYNLFIYFSTRDSGYIYYILYIFCFLLQSISLKGYGRDYLPQFLFLNNIAPILYTELSFFFGLIFTKNFLQTKIYLPGIDKILNFAIFLSILGIIFSFTISYSIAIRYATLTSFLAGFLLLYTSISSLRTNYRPARFFTIGWAMLSLGAIIYALRMAGLIPHNFITNSGYQITSVLEVLLLSLSLGDKINLMKKEFSANLEEKVSLRTRELSDALEVVHNQKL